MSKTLLSAALIAGLGIAAFVPGSANAADGTISFTGQIVAQTCKVTNSAPSVTLPWVFAPSLLTVGATGGATPFAINITGCDSTVKTAQTFFSGANIDASTGNLKSTGPGTNVQLQLLNAGDSSIIQLNQNTVAAQHSLPANVSSGNVTLNYIAQYVAPTGNASAGAVTSSVAFTMIYQ